jgi:CheY-like chemotaxis protein/HPt (histidine-containing phosphotransfer) domain-containing protein
MQVLECNSYQHGRELALQLAGEGKELDLLVASADASEQELLAFREWLGLLSSRDNMPCISLTESKSTLRASAWAGGQLLRGVPLLPTVFLNAVVMALGMDAGSNTATVRRPPAAASVEEAEANGQLILLAEDNETNQLVISQQLHALGYFCEVANDGVEALDKLSQRHYALLLTDCNMPNMDGFQLTARIRAQEAEQLGQRRQIIIAATANAMQEDAERCRAAGMDDFVSKPITLDALGKALGRWLSPQVEADIASANANAPGQPSSPQSLQAQGIAPLDPSVLSEMLGEDAVLHGRILRSFIDSSRGIVADMEAGLAQGHADIVRAAVHKMKSSARSIGALALGDWCEQTEKAAAAGDWKSIQARQQSIQAGLDAVIAYIHAHYP